jgi:Domain of unknown function (DUF4190)
MKPCPYCATQIKETAVQCASCGRWLDPRLDSTLNADSPPLLLPPRTTSGLAIGSLVCAIFGFGPASLAAIVLGYLALRQIRRDPLRIQGKRMATAAIIVGWLGFLTLTVVLVLGIYFWRPFRKPPNGPPAKQVRLITAGFTSSRPANQSAALAEISLG